jgi:predicted nucleotidyltransferase
MSLTKEKILEELRNRKDILINEYDVKSISLAGSYATNKNNENSDIDFIVEFNKASYDSLFNLKNFLENLFTKRVDIIRLRPSIKKRSLDIIQKDMINV